MRVLQCTRMKLHIPALHFPPMMEVNFKAHHPAVDACNHCDGIVLPLVGVAMAIIMAWGRGVYWTDLGLLLAFYVITVFGVTVGFHRLFVHRSFETYTWMKFIWAVMGSIAVQGSVFQWVGQHRLHHQFADREGDPHSPHTQGLGILGMIKGLWHAHVGWLFHTRSIDIGHYVKDLTSVSSLRTADRLFPLWVALGLILPAIIGGAINRSWGVF